MKPCKAMGPLKCPPHLECTSKSSFPALTHIEACSAHCRTTCSPRAWSECCSLWLATAGRTSRAGKHLIPLHTEHARFLKLLIELLRCQEGQVRGLANTDLAKRACNCLDGIWQVTRPVKPLSQFRRRSATVGRGCWGRRRGMRALGRLERWLRCLERWFRRQHRCQRRHQHSSNTAPRATRLHRCGGILLHELDDLRAVVPLGEVQRRPATLRRGGGGGLYRRAEVEAAPGGDVAKGWAAQRGGAAPAQGPSPHLSGANPPGP